jgi:hypothetical protein
MQIVVRDAWLDEGGTTLHWRGRADLRPEEARAPHEHVHSIAATLPKDAEGNLAADHSPEARAAFLAVLAQAKATDQAPDLATLAHVVELDAARVLTQHRARIAKKAPPSPGTSILDHLTNRVIT